MSTKYFGIYRGTVADNADPAQRGRIKAVVPEVSGNSPLGWALPCVPLAAKPAGLFVLPAVGADVWLQFEAGDPERPVWVGGLWDAGAAASINDGA